MVITLPAVIIVNSEIDVLKFFHGLGIRVIRIKYPIINVWQKEKVLLKKELKPVNHLNQ